MVSIDELIKPNIAFLQNYTYVDKLEIFYTLPLFTSIKYINKYTGDFRHGGLLVKVYKKNDNWYGMLKQKNNKMYTINFNSNHIFALLNKQNKLKAWLRDFLHKIES